MARFRSRLIRSTAFAAAMTTMVGGFEGFRSYAYRDPVGIPTACFGETKGIKMGMTFTRAECETKLVASLIEHERGMVACLPNADNLPDPTYGAALSFTYNVGTGAFCGSTMARKLRAGDIKGACEELPKWVKATIPATGIKVTLPGLVNRRAEERALCLGGV